jgi:hypothetical protein
VKDAAACAKMGRYLSMSADGAMQISLYIVWPTGNEYWTT